MAASSLRFICPPAARLPDDAAARLSERARRAALTTLANGGVSAARALASFATVSLLMRFLGREAYGLAATITGMAGWLSISQGGLGQSLRNEMIRMPRAAGGLFAGAFLSQMWIVGIVGLALTAAVPWLPWRAILNAPGFAEPGLMVASLWIVLLTSLFGLVRSAYAAFQSEFRMAPAMLAGVVASFGLVLCGVKMHWGATAVVSASLSANLLGLAICLVAMERDIGVQFRAARLTEQPDWPRGLHRAGLWFFVIETCSILIFEADLFLVNLLLGQAQAASFALHAQLFLYVETGLALVVSPWWSAFGDAWNSGDRDWLRAGVGRLALAAGLLGVCGVALALAVGRPVMKLWSHGEVAWNPLLGVLIGAAVVIQGIVCVYATALGALGVARDPARVAMAQAALNICACVLLIRRFGVTGGALGSLVTYTFTSGLYVPWKARRALA